MTQTTAPTRSQAWFPGRYIAVRYITGLEVLREQPRRLHGGVAVSKTVIHGTARELRALAAQLLDAADRVEAEPPGRHRVAPQRQLRAA
jgi:hypothetical protein